MSKFVLTLNSHQLSDFQRCECSYMYSHLVGIESSKPKEAFQKGSILGRWLNLYYHGKIKPKSSVQKVLYNPLIWTKLIQDELGWNQADSFKLYSTLIAYSRYYKDETWTPVAIEAGFSKVLYEDEDNLFVYEGRIDLLANTEKDRLIIDHKSQKMSYSIYEFNNQVIGYLWASGATQFVYNYLTLTKDPKFSREVHQFTSDQIKAWKDETVKWFFRIKAAHQKVEFLKSLQCNSQFGVCQFHTICEQPNENVKLFIIKANYNQKKKYRSW